MIRFRHFHEQWFETPSQRRRQRFNFFRPFTMRGIGITVWAHEFCVGFAAREAEWQGQEFAAVWRDELAARGESEQG